MRPHHRIGVPLSVFALATLAAVTLTGCSRDAWTEPHSAPTAVGVLGPGFEPSASPSPEATVHPSAGSWDRVKPGPGYRVVLLTAGDSKPTRTLTKAIRDWADTVGADLRIVSADDHLVDGIVRGIDLHPDLIVSAGNDLVDPLATVTASHLDQQFLVVGAEIGEPTENVTAVDWTGASFRGAGLAAPSKYDPDTFTAERCGAAVRAGVAAVLHGLTGIVLWID